MVGNATQTAHYYQSRWGMELEAYRGPENGNRDHKSFVLALRLDPVRLQRRASTPTARSLDHHRQHGDGVVDIALEVPDVDKCIAHARSAGRDGPRASRTTSPTSTARSGSPRSRRTARPATRWSTARSYDGPYLPGYVAATSTRSSAARASPSGCSRPLDHCVGNVELGRMDEWVTFYNRVMGFTNMAEFIGDDIATDYSALMSKVVANGNHRVKFPLNEPAIAKKKSQIDEYLEFYRRRRLPAHRARDQRHPAHRSTSLRANGVEFLDTPDSYYEDPELRARIGNVRVPIEELQKRKILVDRDEDGYLLQIFTKPMGDRPTVFFELIERHGSLGFGKGNFKALFEAIEREQDARGNL